MKDWISVKELAEIKGVTPRAIRKAISNNKYISRTVQTGTGVKYEILFNPLNNNVQNCIDIDKANGRDTSPVSLSLKRSESENYRNNNEKNEEPNLIKGYSIPTHAKQIALARFDLVNLWIDYKKISKNRTEAGKEFLELYNQGKMYPVLFNILGSVAIGTIYRWSKILKKSDDYTVLIPNYDYGQKESHPKLTHEEELIFKSFLLSPNKTNIGKATKLTKFILNKKGLYSPTSERNFRRYADNFKQKHYDEWILAREGQKALRDKVQPYITRDI
jgi:hypothetical protein